MNRDDCVCHFMAWQNLPAREVEVPLVGALVLNGVVVADT